MYFIDRIECGFAVLIGEAEKAFTVKASFLPERASEGDAVIFSDGRWSVETDATEHRRNDVRLLMDELFIKPQPKSHKK